MPLIKLRGFAPDLDPSTPGILTDCSGLMPTLKGFRPLPSASPAFAPLPGVCMGAFLAQYLNGISRLFAATTQHLYEGQNGIWTQVDGGTVFTGTTSSPWSFEMFGNDCIATNGADAPQKAGLAGNFAALGGSPPIAPLIVATSGFVLLFESNNWHSSGGGTDSVWTNLVSDLSASGSLYDTPGPLTAAGKLGRQAVAYKTRGIYLGTFVGDPVIWDWSLRSPEAGTPAQGALINMGPVHAFVGEDDFYVFDGTIPRPIMGADGPNPIKEWFFANLDMNYVGNIQGAYDHILGTAIWYFPSINASPRGSLDTWVAWNFRTNQWTKSVEGTAIERVVRPFVPATLPWTYSKFETTYGTYSGVPALPYNAQMFFGSSVLNRALFKSDHILYTLNGAPGASSFTTGDYGDGKQYFFLNRMRPAFSQFPASPSLATLTELSRRSLGETPVTGDTEALTPDGWINVRANDRYHRWKFDFSDDYEIVALDPEIFPAGDA